MTAPAEVDVQRVLDLELDDNEAGAVTIRDYLVALLTALWREGEGFSGKRPLGSGGWEYDLYLPLVRAGIVDGAVDGDIDIDRFDEVRAHEVIAMAIGALGRPPT